MHVLVTGGNGFIGRRLVSLLLEHNHQVTVIDRSVLPSAASNLRQVRCDLLRENVPLGIFEGIDAVVHLAGVSVAGLWTPRRKRLIRASRVETARKLAAAISRLPSGQRPGVIISASAIGYYGDGGERMLSEQDDPGDDFLARVCQAWESAWQELPADIRRVSLRTAIVLGPHGGLLKPLQRAVRLGWAPLPGGGRQWVSWVSRDDIARAYLHALTTPALRGEYNVAAPSPVRFGELVEALARRGANPVIRVSVPGWLVKVALGEAAQVVLASQRVSGQALQRTGFTYADTDLVRVLGGATNR